MTSRVEGLVEFFTVRDGEDEDVQCARCGSSIDFEQCPDCGGDGWVDDEDDSWAYMEPELVPCGLCCGTGGWWVCLSTPEYCKAHPMPGREHIRFPLEPLEVLHGTHD